MLPLSETNRAKFKPGLPYEWQPGLFSKANILATNARFTIFAPSCHEATYLFFFPYYINRNFFCSSGSDWQAHSICQFIDVVCILKNSNEPE